MLPDTFRWLVHKIVPSAKTNSHTRDPFETPQSGVNLLSKSEVTVVSALVSFREAQDRDVTKDLKIFVLTKLCPLASVVVADGTKIPVLVMHS